MFQTKLTKTYEYQLNFDKSKRYIYSLSTALLLTNIFGHVMYSLPNKFDKLKELYNNINVKQKNGNNGTCVYRCEIRCKLLDADEVTKNLLSFLTIDNFIYCSSDYFFKTLQRNINMFCNLIKSGGQEEEYKVSTPDSLVFSIITESIMKNMFISGIGYCESLSNEHNVYLREKLPKQQYGFTILPNIKNIVSDLFKKLSSCDKMGILNAQIKYSFDLNKIQKYLVELIPRLYYNDKLTKLIY